MISADLITDSTSSTSSMRTGSKICRYPSQTSTAVRTSNAPHTQKYWPLPSSCFATSCIVFSPQLDLGRHQVDQGEDEHPDQVDEVPIQSRHLHILRVVILRLQEQNNGRHNQTHQQRVNQVMKNIVRWNQKISCEP